MVSMFCTQLLYYNLLDVECQELFWKKRRSSIAVENQDTIVSNLKVAGRYFGFWDMLTSGGMRNGTGKAGGISDCPTSDSGG